MKRSNIVISFLFLTILPCNADEYIIKALNGQSIQIGLRKCRVDSIFKSNETIHWEKNGSGVSIIEAQNVESKAICYFVPTGKQNKDNSPTSNIIQRFLNYFIKMTHLSTREADTYSLDEALSTEHFLADSIKIKTNDLSEGRQYFASFHINGIKHSIPLSVENGNIIFERSKFIIDGMILPYKYILTIYYKEGDYYHEITNGMSITIIDIKE